MPEGHSIHRIANTFRDLFVGTQVRASSPQGRFALGAQVLDGLTVTESFAVGKHQFMRFDGDRYLHVHLGIYGAWDLSVAGSGAVNSAAGNLGVSKAATREGEGVGEGETTSGPVGRMGQTGEYASMGAPRRVRIGETESELDLSAFPPEPRGEVRLRMLSEVACVDLRGPTVCEVITGAEVAAKIALLGPDPLVEPGRRGCERFYELVSRRRVPVGQVLMDQQVVAGIGNIYRAEMLFRAGIDPFVAANSLGFEVYERLWRDWTHLLKLGVKTGKILTRDPRGVARQRHIEDVELRHWVYGRQGLPCRTCGTPVAMTVMQGRKLYWCPGCQGG